MISAATLLGLLDKIDAGDMTGHSLARQQKWSEMSSLLAGCGDLTFIGKTYRQLAASQQQAPPDRIGFGVSQPFLRTLEAAYLSGVAGFATLDAYLTAQNTATPFTTLVGPNLAYLYWLVKSNGSSWKGNKTPTASTYMLSPRNVFAPTTTFSASSVGAGGAITAGLTGNVIQAANAAGVVQTLTGTATAGAYAVTLGGQTASIAFNASAAAVQAALTGLGLPSLTGLSCTGGPLGTAPVPCALTGALTGVTEGTILADSSAATGGVLTVQDTTQGYAPARGLQATATVAINGSLSVHVTYSGTNAAGGAIAGQVGTLVLDTLAAGATTASGAWTPATAGDRIYSVTAIAYLSGTATAGDFALQSIIERVTS
jgi:hypothetical protein